MEADHFRRPARGVVTNQGEFARSQALEGLRIFHLLKHFCLIPLLVVMGVYDYWKYVYFFSGGLSKCNVWARMIISLFRQEDEGIA